MELFAQQINELKNIMSGYTISDDATKQTIAEVYATHNYLLDPHGAVAYHALAQYLQNHSEQGGFILETAHPVKFPETVEKIIGKKIPIPSSAQHLFAKEKQSILLPPTFEALKAFLSNR
jgi:threonine synthase